MTEAYPSYPDHTEGYKYGKDLDSRPTPYQQEQKIQDRHIPHGVEGHTGWRCKSCALGSDNPSLIFSFSSRHDRQQNALQDWNTHNDQQVAGHINDCPMGLRLKDCEVHSIEPKPEPQFERVMPDRDAK